MTVNWEALGAIAEMAGAVGVIATLFYLARQLNQNTETVRASAIAASDQAAVDGTRLMVQDPALGKVYWAGLADRAALSDKELHQFDNLMSIFVHSMNHTLTLARLGYDDLYDVRESIEFYAEHPGFVAWWQEYLFMFPDSLGQEINACLARSRVKPAAQQSAAADSA